MATLKTKLLIRNDTKKNWDTAEQTSAEPIVLGKGELGIEWNDGVPKLKIGDGSTRWSQLKYFGGSFTITGTGNTIVDAGYDSNTGVLTLTKGNRLTGSGLTADTILLGNGSYDVKTSSKTIVTNLGSDDNTLPTSKAVRDYVGIMSNAAMIMRGTLGTDGTITDLPKAELKTFGDAYKVITDGEYTVEANSKIAAKAGDVFVCYKPKDTEDKYAWMLIPSGDDVEDTWRAVYLDQNKKLGNEIGGANLVLKNSETSGVTVGYNEGFIFDVKTGYTTDIEARKYKIEKDNTGNLFVNVPWSDTTGNAYGIIDVKNSSDVTDLADNDGSISATELSDKFTLTALNKWIKLAAVNGGKQADVIKIAHRLRTSSVGKPNIVYGQTDNISLSTSTKSFAVPYLKIDEAGHVNDIESIQVTLPDTAFYGCDRGIDTTTGSIGHTNSITAQNTTRVWGAKLDAQGHITGSPQFITILDGGSATTADWGTVTA